MEGGLGEGKQAGEIPLYKYGGRAASKPVKGWSWFWISDRCRPLLRAFHNLSFPHTHARTRTVYQVGLNSEQHVSDLSSSGTLQMLWLWQNNPLLNY